MTRRAIHIDLELDVEGDEVRGSAGTDGGPRREFTGWVGLIATLDALIEPGAEGTPGSVG